MNFKNISFFTAGIFFLTLAKAKHFLLGYSTPKPFNILDTEKCIEYDLKVVKNWLYHLQRYTNNVNFLENKNVLELGPGSDLGIGIYLLSLGCAQYNACDVNNLMKSTPDSFYEQFFSKLKVANNETDVDFLKEQLSASKAGNASRLNYVVRNDFDLVSAFGEATVDLVFSQAAFEHFDDIYNTIFQLSKVCKNGATIIAEIDLRTHSRWIRDQDPNNIYRYPTCVYNLFKFRGIPNRVRPFQYKDTFERYGWTDVTIIPFSRLGDRDLCYDGIHKDFLDEKNQMDYLSIMLCAKRGNI